MFNNARLPIILLTTFLNTLGIGLLIPVFLFIVAQYTGGNIQLTATYVGILTAIYALCDFLAAPFIGVLSDKYGRKPILIFSLIGSVIGYIFLGIGGSLAILFVGRIIDGISAGNISSIFAYVGDITEPKDRAKNYGLVGATLGVGFLIGPALGGYLANFGLSFPMFFAAIITVLNILLIIFFLPESHQPEDRVKTIHLKDANPFGWITDTKSQIFLRIILFASFFHFVAFAQLQGNGSVLLSDVLSWGPQTIGLAFFVIGIVDIIMQGFLTEKLIPKFGEKKLSMYGLAVTILSYSLLAILSIFHLPILAYLAFVLFAIGTGLFEPSMAAMVANSADRTNQGKAQGAYQSLQSLTRVIGPLLAAFLYVIGTSYPYIVSAILAAVSVYLFTRIQQPESSEQSH